MNVVLIVIDSLNRSFLSPYGNEWIQTPNFERLAKNCVIMDQHWTGSIPTMPARREILTGRYEYIWRDWGPLEPYDITIAELCQQNDQISMLITDCYHYFQGGSGNYHFDFTGWELIRGQEGDNWKTEPLELEHIQNDIFIEKKAKAEAYFKNTAHFRNESDFFSPRLFHLAAEWLDNNYMHQNFFLMIDSFDVHEPFHVPSPYDQMYNTGFEKRGPIWIKSGSTDRYRPESISYIRSQYSGKVSMLDHWMGLILDRFDRYGLWDATMLIVTSDHGHHLGEHNWIGKHTHPIYQHMAKIPLFIWTPGLAVKPSSRCISLTSQIDLYPTILESLNINIPPDYLVHGYSMHPLLRGERDQIRDIAHTSYFGFPVAITDGHWIFHKYPRFEDNTPLYRYGIHLEGYHSRSKEPYINAETGQFLPFTDCIVYRSPDSRKTSWRPIKFATKDLLFNLKVGENASQNQIINHPEIAECLRERLTDEFIRLQAPEEQYARLGLLKP